MDYNLIKEKFILASTHYDGDIEEDNWHEMVWVKETHYPERHRFYYTYQYVYIDLELYEATNKIVISYSDCCVFGGRLPERFKKTNSK
jgi:hypothetical protein